MVARPPAGLTAATWDTLARHFLADGARGRVHSVFDRALNLTLGDGTLIGLVGPAAGNGPATVMLASPPARTFPSSGLAPGQPWRVTGQRLILGPAAVVDLGPAQLWSPARHRWDQARRRRSGVGAGPRACPVSPSGQPGQARGPAPTEQSRVPGAGLVLGHAEPGAGSVGDAKLPGAVALDEVLRRLARAEQAASAAVPADGLAPLVPHLEPLVSACLRDVELAGIDTVSKAGKAPPVPASGVQPYPLLPDPVAERALSAAADLVQGWLAADPETVTAAATRLSGLGPGLTPSGDDLLAGFLIGVASAGDQPDPALSGAVVRATRGRTTDVAAARVRHAADGLIEERMDDVLTALLTGSDTDLEALVQRAATWGHTSGVDTLVGLFLGLRIGLADPSPDPSGFGER